MLFHGRFSAGNVLEPTLSHGYARQGRRLLFSWLVFWKLDQRRRFLWFLLLFWRQHVGAGEAHSFFFNVHLLHGPAYALPSFGVNRIRVCPPFRVLVGGRWKVPADYPLYLRELKPDPSCPLGFSGQI